MEDLIELSKILEYFELTFSEGENEKGYFSWKFRTWQWGGYRYIYNWSTEGKTISEVVEKAKVFAAGIKKAHLKGYKK